MDILMQIVIGMAIGWRSLLALNDMGPATHHGIRILHLVLGTLGAWIALTPLFPEYWDDLPKLGALAVYLMLELVNRRRVIA